MEKRHTCIICGQKRYERLMTKVFKKSWACNTRQQGLHFISYDCYCHSDIYIAKQLIEISKGLTKVSVKSIF